MDTIRVSELGAAVRSFFERVLQEGVVIEDEAGEPRWGVIPYRRPSAEQKHRGWDVLQRLQEKTSRALREQGLTEEDIDRALRDGK